MASDTPAPAIGDVRKVYQAWTGKEWIPITDADAALAGLIPTAEPTDEALIDMWRHEEWEVACATRDALRARLAAKDARIAELDGLLSRSEGRVKKIVDEQLLARAEAAEAALAECRAKVIEECAAVAEHAHLVPPDGGSPTDAEKAIADEAARRIRSLRGQNVAV